MDFFLNKQKHSAVVIVMTSTPPSNGICKWVGQTGANRAFDELFMTNCSSTTLVRTPNLVINNIWSSSNFAFPMSRVLIKKKMIFQIHAKANAHIQAIVANKRNFVMNQKFDICQVTVLSASNIFEMMLDTSMLGSFFFLTTFF
ncbi:hypothetical protein RFI_30283 [Reticulomyxa filosa]|uniref:Uncharacterized protein n=1 Tax=Reticulomyxa filosa TaxID=46433 RepID=X6M296_RETFI|nr:hypothetical protein RFI_30283 [Reticulomyxa filosa]|eukprot:ETO07110.1 hypothetical protein RFI_30283 [Reticulomyxa filosa]